MNLFLDSGATFSEDRKYRRLLWRIWDAALPLCCLIMLNPSKAGEVESDPTVTRQMERARLLGCGGLLVVNAYDIVATDPRDMKADASPCSAENNAAIFDAAKRAHESGGKVIVGWGAHCTQDRADEIVRLLKDIPLWCVARTKGGMPGHPLYVGYDVALERWPSA